jgi:hypothetical protein
LARLAHDSDWLVVMRAIDLMEKLAHEHPDWIENFENSNSPALISRARQIRSRLRTIATAADAAAR